MTKAPSILISKPDTLGDLVLLEPLLRTLEQGLPGTRIRILVREAYLPLAPLLGASVEWLGIAADPFSKGPDEAWSQVEALLRVLGEEPPELILAPHRQRSWLTDALLASFPSARSIGLSGNEGDPFFAAALQHKLGLGRNPSYTQVLSPAAELPEWRSSCLVAGLLGLQTDMITAPTLRLPQELRDETVGLLKSLGLAPGAFVACAAAGHANVPIKGWPAENFAACATWLHREHSLPCLLVGSHAERSYLEGIQQLAGEDAVRLWTGGPEDLTLLAGLCGESRLFLGNDTGAMHLAAALGRPVCALFGGGTWPRFVPSAAAFAALVNPLPCFGCAWDCCFGDAPCVKALGEAEVIQALGALLRGESPGVITLQKMNSDSLSLTRKAAERHDLLCKQLAQRQQEFERTVVLATAKDGEIGRLKQAAVEKDAEIGNLKAAAVEKDGEIGKLKSAAVEKDTEISGLKAASLGQDAEIAALKQACDERLALVNRLSDDIRRIQAEAARLGALASGHQQAAEAASALAAKTEAFYQGLAPDAAAWASQLNEARTEAANLAARVAAQDAESAVLRQHIAALEASLANISAGLGTLELHRLHQRQLREKEDMIQLLHRSCLERESLIRRLSLGESRLARLGSGLGGWWEARVAAPLRSGWEQWLRQGHWMQLGELRQHEPRPLRWDRGIPRLPAGDASPAIGLVTPSYNQAVFLGSTLRSVLDQEYQKLYYVVQDGGSTDASPRLIAGHADRLFAWESARDGGQSAAIRRGFERILPKLGPDDLMAWLNSDDLLAPRSLGFVADYFARNPEVDAVYGHRIIIDGHDREIGRWILPPHRNGDLRWTDFVPQETLFWRRRAWDRVGGLDPALHFALDWDFLLRLEEAGAVIRRLPFFLGAFRVHEESKTHSQINKRGREEMDQLLKRTHGALPDHATLDREVSHLKARGALCSRLLSLGLRR
jgi:ADP-heptose:LPS heptosyltransferase/GT2 family glycosyltransferase